MNEEKAKNDRLSTDDIAEINNVIEKLDNILAPRLAIIRATINGEIPGKDIRLRSTFMEINKALDQVKKIKEEMTRLMNRVNDKREIALGRTYQKALAIYHSVEEAARNNVPGAQEIYEDLKQYLPEDEQTP